MPDGQVILEDLDGGTSHFQSGSPARYVAVEVERIGGTGATGGGTGGGVTDHGALDGLDDNDHPQYALDADLGNSATRDVGTTTGTVAAGDDSRLAAAATATQPADLSSAISTHAEASDPHGDRAYTDTSVSTHSADTTSVHGITDTSALVLTDDDRLPPDPSAQTDGKVATIASGAITWATPSEGGGGGVTDFFDVTDYGAAGDGSTNDTTALQDALDAAAGGGVVWLPAGTYLTDPLDVPDGVTIQGVGWASIIKLRPQNVGTLGDHGVLQVYGTSPTHLTDIHLHNFAIDGSSGEVTGTTSLNMEGIDFKYLDGGTVIGVHVYDTISEAFDLDNTTGLYLSGNVATNAGGNGYHLSNGAVGNTLIGNVADGCGFDWSRQGFDQYDGSAPEANYNRYIGNRAIGNYRNYKIDGTVASFEGNTSEGTTTAANVFTATSGEYDPLDAGGGAASTPEWVDITEANAIDLSVPWVRATIDASWSPSFTNSPSDPELGPTTLLLRSNGTNTVTFSGVTWLGGSAPTIGEDEFALIEFTSDPDNIGVIGDIKGIGTWTPPVPPETFDPWDTGEGYPTPTHAVWAEDPDWTNPGDGNPVSSWRNESGGGDPASTLTSRPTYRASTTAFNSKPTVQFSGSQHLEYDIVNVSQPFVIVVVGSVEGVSTAQALVGSSNSGSSRLGASGSNQWTYNWGTAVANGTRDSNPHVFVHVANGSSSSLYVDGTLVASGSGGSGALHHLDLGVAHDGDLGTLNRFLTGHIAYAAVYSGKTSRDTEIQDLETALSTYYDL